MRGLSPSTGSRSRYRRSGGPAPERINALLDEAAAHYAAGRLEDATVVYRTVEAEDGEDIRARYSLAVIDLRRGRFGEARRRFRAVLRRQGEHFEAFHNLGVAEQALGGWDEAAEAYARALALRPGAVETSFARAIALAVLGKVDESIVLYRMLATMPTCRTSALTRLAMLQPLSSRAPNERTCRRTPPTAPCRRRPGSTPRFGTSAWWPASCRGRSTRRLCTRAIASKVDLESIVLYGMLATMPTCRTSALTRLAMLPARWLSKPNELNWADRRRRRPCRRRPGSARSSL